MLINTANLAALFTAYSLQYQSGYGQAEIFYRDLCTIVPSSTETGTYVWMDRIPKARKWVGPKTVQNAVARAPRVVINEPFELTMGVPKHKIQDDSYGVFSPTAMMMGMQAAKWPDDVLLEQVLLVNSGRGPTAFDGRSFFDTGHPINLEDASVGTYDNLETTFPLTLTNYATAKARMRSFKGADGRPIGARGNLLVVPPSLEGEARTILNSSFYPRLADGASLGDGDVAMAENVWKGTADLLVIDELEDNPGDWYLLDTRKPIKPFIFQLREAPVFAYLMNPGDPNVFWNKEYVMGFEARGNADCTLPFLGFKGEA